jgi:hypothetical protein
VSSEQAPRKAGEGANCGLWLKCIIVKVVMTGTLCIRKVNQEECNKELQKRYGANAKEGSWENGEKNEKGQEKHERLLLPP